MHLGLKESLIEKNVVGKEGGDTATKGIQKSRNRKSTSQAHESSPSSLLLSLSCGNKMLLTVRRWSAWKVTLVVQEGGEMWKKVC